MSILDKQANGKYVRGVQGYRNAAKAAKYATKLPRRIGNNLGYLGVALSSNNLIHNVNARNVIDMAATVTSFAYWEVGVAYTFGSAYFDWVIMPNVQQIRTNTEEGVPPMRNVYNPQTGMYDY